MSLRFPSVVLLALSASSFAGCKSPPLDVNAACTADCQEQIDCNVPNSSCPQADQVNVCVTACKTAVAALTPSTREAFDPCFGCRTGAVAGTCFELLPKDTCADECDAAAVAAESAFDDAFLAALQASGPCG